MCGIRRREYIRSLHVQLNGPLDRSNSALFSAFRVDARFFLILPHTRTRLHCIRPVYLVTNGRERLTLNIIIKFNCRRGVAFRFDSCFFNRSRLPADAPSRTLRRIQSHRRKTSVASQ